MRYEKFMPIAVREKKISPTAEKILNAAYDLFMEKGFLSVTMRDIASRAGVNLSLIPYHFTSKENLGKRVNMKMINDIYESIDYSGMEELTNAEKLYVSNLLHWDYMQNNVHYSRFFSEFMECVGTSDVSTQKFVELTRAVIQDYQLDISESENEIYLSAMKGAEQLMIYRYLKKELSVTYKKIIDILISNYFFNIGLSDEEIAKNISNAHCYYDQHLKQTAQK